MIVAISDLSGIKGLIASVEGPALSGELSLPVLPSGIFTMSNQDYEIGTVFPDAVGSKSTK